MRRFITFALAALSAAGCGGTIGGEQPRHTFDVSGPVLVDSGGGQLDAGAAADSAQGVADGGGAADVGSAGDGDWVVVTPGTFTMGSPGTEACREVVTGKESAHQVTLQRAFEIQRTEVTQQQYAALMGHNPSFFASVGTCASADCPVDSVNWNEAAQYCNALSEQAKLEPCYSCGGPAIKSCKPADGYAGAKIYDCPGYRLPTEAEWEYAYRAGKGNADAFHSGPMAAASDCKACAADANLALIGWHCANAADQTHPVGLKQPNDWKIYDMAGNVYEWCHDWYVEDLGSGPATNPAGPSSGTYKVLRGGAHSSAAKDARAASRRADQPFQQYDSYGFRCVRSL